MENWGKIVKEFKSSGSSDYMILDKYQELVEKDNASMLDRTGEVKDMYKKRDKIWEHYQKGRVEGGSLDGAPYYIGLHHMKWYVIMKERMLEYLSEVEDKKDLKGCLVSAGVSYESGHKEIELALEYSGMVEWDGVGNVKEVKKPKAILYVTESTDTAITSLEHSVASLIERGVPEGMIQIVKWDLVDHSPFDNEIFDFMFSALVTCYFTKEEQEVIWKEFYRIMKKDGLLIQSMITTQRGDTVFIPTKNTGNPFVKIFTLLTAPTLWPLRIPGTKAGALKGYINWMSSGYAKMSEQALKEGWFEYLSPEVLMEIGEEVGFTDNKFERNSEFWEKSIPIVITINKK